MKHLNIKELYGLILLNGFKPEKTNRMLGTENLICFGKKKSNNNSIFLYFTEKQWIFVEAQYLLNFNSNSKYVKKLNEISAASYLGDHINLKGKPFDIRCSGYFNSDNNFFLTYKPKYYETLQDMQYKSYRLEFNTLYIEYNYYKVPYILPIFFGGEECADYLYSIING